MSPSKQLLFLRIMYDLISNYEVQFIIATHSPILLGFPRAQILCFDQSISDIRYEETDHYNITKRFLENRSRVLTELFEEN